MDKSHYKAIVAKGNSRCIKGVKLNYNFGIISVIKADTLGILFDKLNNKFNLKIEDLTVRDGALRACICKTNGHTGYNYTSNYTIRLMCELDTDE